MVQIAARKGKNREQKKNIIIFSGFFALKTQFKIIGICLKRKGVEIQYFRRIFGTAFVDIFLNYDWQKTGCQKRYFEAFPDTLSCFLGVSGGAFCFKRLIIGNI